MGLGFKHSRTNFLSVSGILLLFVFQQFILYYSLYYLKNVEAVLYTLILDVPLVLYIFFGLLVRSFVSSVRYSIVWCMYSATIVIKMILLAFMDKSDKTLSPIAGLSNESNDMLLSFFGLYVTPIVFSLFNSASKSSLFQDSDNVSVDELLHSDLGLSTTIDLWDLILMFSHLLKYYKVEMQERERIILNVRLFVVFIIFVLITIFLLGLVIPTVDGDYKVEDKFKTNIFNEAIHWVSNCLKMMTRSRGAKARASGDMKTSTILKSVNEGSSSLDMFTMAKFTFIIGFFLIDIPFLAYRLYILIKYNVFSLLLYKNFIFLFLRPYRLNMSQLAERDTAKGWQAAFFSSDLLSMKTTKQERTNEAFNLFEESEVESDSQLVKRFSRKFSIRKKKSQIFKSALVPRLLSKLTFTTRPFTKSDPMYLSSKLFGNYNPNEPSNQNTAQGTRDESIDALEPSPLSSIDYPNVPEEPEDMGQHSYKMYILKMLRKSKMLPIKSFPLSVIMRQWAHFLFGRPRNFETTFVADPDNFNVVKYNELAFVVTLACQLAPRVCLVLLFYFEELRSPRDIMYNLSRDASFSEKFALQVCFSFSFVQFLFFFHTSYLLDSLFSFARDLLSLYSMMVCLHCFKTLLISHDYAQRRGLPLLFLFMLYPVLLTLTFLNNMLPRSLKHPKGEDMVRRGERDRKLLNLKLVYLLLKYCIGPVSLNRRLCSPDLVEMVKIHDALLHAQWTQFVYSLCFRLLVCCNLDSHSSCLVLLVDVLLFLLYNTASQAMRSLMFRKYEVNFVVMRMLRLLRFDWDAGFDRLENSVTFADIDKYLRVQGLFSSPGIVVPPFA